VNGENDSLGSRQLAWSVGRCLGHDESNKRDSCQSGMIERRPNTRERTRVVETETSVGIAPTCIQMESESVPVLVLINWPMCVSPVARAWAYSLQIGAIRHRCTRTSMRGCVGVKGLDCQALSRRRPRLQCNDDICGKSMHLFQLHTATVIWLSPGDFRSASAFALQVLV
jgi:hypothetical protein